ncbi:MAG: stage II sporulation protein M [Eubacteriaceae bacterium]|nr:stage II sporulation protein M [Eubacteriaceae bacterium]
MDTDRISIFSLRKQYSLSGSFCRHRILPVFLGTLGIAIGISVLLTLFFEQHPAYSQEILRAFSEKARSVMTDGGISWPKLLLNNIEASLVGVVLGFVPFLFLPALVLISNAAVIGAVLALYSLNGSNVAAVLAAGVLPHGIFEITAVVLSMSMGIYLCYTICSLITGTNRGNKKAVMKQTVTDITRTFLCIVIPLLVIAALIETYVTPIILDKVI